MPNKHGRNVERNQQIEDVEDALAWLSDSQRDLTALHDLLNTARNGGAVPSERLVRMIADAQHKHNAAGELVRRLRGRL